MSDTRSRLTFERDGKLFLFYASFFPGGERERNYRAMAQSDPRVLVVDSSLVFGDNSKALAVVFQEDAFDELRLKATST